MDEILETTQSSPETEQLARLEILLQRYLSKHGDWREITSSPSSENPTSTQTMEFRPCECTICQDALKTINPPALPYD